jgi:hypothetical protein
MRRVPALLAALTLLLVPAAGTNAASSGTVGVSVSVAAPCVTVSGSFDYGTRMFSTQLNPSKSPTTLGPVVTNCSGVTEGFTGQVSNLTGGQATWTPVSAVNPCTNGLNTFDLYAYSVNGSSGFDLTANTQPSLGTLNDATPSNWSSTFTMPCTGSDGAGSKMSGTISLMAFLN